ncbi:MAG: GldG family protein, partial [Deltaproteobacteria bacterium]|nr:GldG family protein [Deltaproteobacteria bacterium]
MSASGSRFLRLKGSSNMAAAVLLVLVLCVAITLLSNRHYFKWDVTAHKEHSLSEKTLQVLKTIREPVAIKAFVQEGQGGAGKVKRLLGAYRYHAPGITFELIDPDRNPAMANRFNVKALNTLIVEGYGSTQTVKVPDEEGVTNALIRLSKGRIVKVYTLSGHGERPFKGSDPESLSRLREDLGRENFEFHDLNLIKTDIPEDASLVMVAAPVKPLFKEEIESLRNHLHKGGNLVIFLEPFIDAGLEGFLKEHGVIISPDVIVDKMSRVMGGDYLMPMVVNYGGHEITRDFRFPCFFPMARSVETAQEKNKDIKVMALAFTSTDSWAETDQKTLKEGRAGFDGEDR